MLKSMLDGLGSEMEAMLPFMIQLQEALGPWYAKKYGVLGKGSIYHDPLTRNVWKVLAVHDTPGYFTVVEAGVQKVNGLVNSAILYHEASATFGQNALRNPMGLLQGLQGDLSEFLAEHPELKAMMDSLSGKGLSA